MKKIILCPNVYRDLGLETTKKIKQILQEIGISSVVSLPFYVVAADLPRDLKYQPIKQAVRDADMLIALGGDGSLLHVAKTAAVNQLPILGVNLGNLGYIAELECSEIERLKELKNPKLKIEQRMMLDVSVYRDQKVVYSTVVLNDAVITKGAVARVVKLQLYLNHKEFLALRGDGMIISTPTGSTAYNLSAGGPIVDPVAQNILITPICAHSLMSSSYVLGTDQVIEVVGLNNGTKTVYLSADGGKAFLLQPEDRVVIKHSKYVTQLVKLRDVSFYETLCAKMADREMKK